MWFSHCMYGTCLVFMFIISLTFVNPQQFFCKKDAVFKMVNRGKPLDEYVISNHYVSSWFECSSKCLDILECVAFSHLTGSTQQSRHDINCEILKSKSEFGVSRGEDEAWTTYEVRSPGVEICSTQNLCLNNGLCVRNSCDAEGYMCICDDLHDGKHCENDQDKENFDVNFTSQQPNVPYIEVDNMITSDLTEFTLSTWFKMPPGLFQYYILSHITNNVTRNIDIWFQTKSNARVPVHKIQTKLLEIIKSRTLDTGGGFLLDIDDQIEAENEINVVFEPGPDLINAERPRCIECGKSFLNSFLYKNFTVAVCDGCRDNDDKHALITKTDAKTQFLLKDCDLERREPILQCIVKKNPHKSTWGNMKLYLKSQVVARSLEIWGDEEAMEEERDRRMNARDKKKQKQFDKKVKELRRAVRTSTWKRDSLQHVHEFPAQGEPGGEIYDEESDTWTKTCRTCGHKVTYEKM